MDFQVRLEDCQLNFPIEPYPGQKLLADTILKACVDGQVAVLESPTGSGKSLAIICAVMAFQEAWKRRRLEKLAKVKEMQKEYEGEFALIVLMCMCLELSAQGLPLRELFKRQYELNKRIDELLDENDSHTQLKSVLERAERADLDLKTNVSYCIQWSHSFPRPNPTKRPRKRSRNK